MNIMWKGKNIKDLSREELEAAFERVYMDYRRISDLIVGGPDPRPELRPRVFDVGLEREGGPLAHYLRKCRP